MTIPWIKKYEPDNSKQVLGQDTAISNLKTFILNFKNQKKHAALIYGSSGTGKTCSVYALANELNLEVIEVNASDFRNKDQINSLLGSALQQRSLFSQGKLILVDEIDGLSGSKDRGGVAAISALLKTPSFPVILTATNPYDQKISTLRSKSELIEFKQLNYTDIFKILKNICEKENITYKEDTLKGLARRAGGDSRAAINDLQTLIKDNKLREDTLDLIDQRKQQEKITTALMKVLKTTQSDIALTAFDNVDEDQDKIMLWLDENIPKEYKEPEDLANAYNAMSRADVFKGRIRRWQHWRFLVYISNLMTAGVATAKKQKYPGFTPYSPTTRILKIWRANMSYQKRKSIAQKLAKATHTSPKYSLKNIYPYIKYIFEKNNTLSSQIAEELELSKEEVQWLRK